MTRWEREGGARPADYDTRWARLVAEGANPHGEADLVASFGPADVLDAGCGTGRVAIELAGRGIDVVGVDRDATLLAHARGKAPELVWVEADLLDVDLGRTFELIVLAGNVVIFLEPGTEAAVVANLARHLAPGGRLVAGFQLRAGSCGPDEYDAHAGRAGLDLVARWGSWDRVPFTAGGDYAVSVHRRPRAPG